MDSSDSLEEWMGFYPITHFSLLTDKNYFSSCMKKGEISGWKKHKLFKSILITYYPFHLDPVRCTAQWMSNYKKKRIRYSVLLYSLHSLIIFFFHAHINIRNFYIYTENIILVSVTTDIRSTPGIHTQEKTSRFTQNTLTIDKNNTAIKCNLFSATRIMLISFRVKIQER